MLADECTQPRETKHLTLRLVSFYQPVAVEEGCFADVQSGLLLLITHPRHEAQGHPPGPEFIGVTVTAVEVGQVVACVGVPQATALGLKDGVETGDEHVGRDTDSQSLVHSLEY